MENVQVELHLCIPKRENAISKWYICTCNKNKGFKFK